MLMEINLALPILNCFKGDTVAANPPSVLSLFSCLSVLLELSTFNCFTVLLSPCCSDGLFWVFVAQWMDCKRSAITVRYDGLSESLHKYIGGRMNKWHINSLRRLRVLEHIRHMNYGSVIHHVFCNNAHGFPVVLEKNGGCVHMDG